MGWAVALNGWSELKGPVGLPLVAGGLLQVQRRALHPPAVFLQHAQLGAGPRQSERRPGGRPRSQLQPPAAGLPAAQRGPAQAGCPIAAFRCVCMTCGRKKPGEPNSRPPCGKLGSCVAAVHLSGSVPLGLWPSNRPCEPRMPAALRPAMAVPVHRLPSRPLLLMGRTVKERSGSFWTLAYYGMQMPFFSNPFSSSYYHPGRLSGSDPTFPAGDCQRCSLSPSGALLYGPGTWIFQPLWNRAEPHVRGATGSTSPRS